MKSRPDTKSMLRKQVLNDGLAGWKQQETAGNTAEVATVCRTPNNNGRKNHKINQIFTLSTQQLKNSDSRTQNLKLSIEIQYRNRQSNFPEHNRSVSPPSFLCLARISSQARENTGKPSDLQFATKPLRKTRRTIGKITDRRSISRRSNPRDLRKPGRSARGVCERRRVSQ